MTRMANLRGSRKTCHLCGSGNIRWGAIQDVREMLPSALVLWHEYTCLDCGYQGIGLKKRDT